MLKDAPICLFTPQKKINIIDTELNIKVVHIAICIKIIIDNPYTLYMHLASLIPRPYSKLFNVAHCLEAFDSSRV